MIAYGSAPARCRNMAGLPFLLVSLAVTRCLLADESVRTFERVGQFDAAVLDEVSGFAPLPDGRYVVHTDDGPPRIHVVDADSSLRASIGVAGSFLQDWEDLTTVAGPDGPLLAIGDVGDNAGVRREPRMRR